MKFCFRRGPTQSESVEAICEGLNIPEVVKYLNSIKEGTRMHLVLRPRPGFDVEAKRNYFHGPVLTWVIDELHDKGIPCSREQMKEEFKKRFIGVDEDGKVRSLADTLEVMVEGDARSPEMKYGEFLSDIRRWCRDVLDSEPPQPDQTDCGEESDSSAIPANIQR